MNSEWRPPNPPPLQLFVLWLAEKGFIYKAVEKGFEWKPYHGFDKCTLREFNKYAAEFGLENPERVLIEMVRIYERVPHGCHVHKNSTAVVFFLGTDYGFPTSPGRLSQYYYKKPTDVRGTWRPAYQGTSVLIPSGTAHDFQPHPGRGLYFLSVQDPPILDEAAGTDDFTVVEPDSEPLGEHGYVR